MAFRDNLAKLRGLAGEKGYRLERAMMNNRWRLIDDTTERPAVNLHGSTAFTMGDAIKFLNSPEAARNSH